MRYYEWYETDIGMITIEGDENFILAIGFGKQERPGASRQNTALTDRAADELNEYLAGRRKAFDLPLNPQGTRFQRNVWKALTAIPYGETRSYREIAVMAENPRACRAVGMANHRNPIAIVIPCHRVIGADGSLVGYGGGLDVKKKLLELERAKIDQFLISVAQDSRQKG